MAETWNDDRLDELSLRVEDGFDRTDRQLHALRTESRTDSVGLRAEMKTEFAAVRKEMRAGFAAVNERFEAIDRRLDALYRVLIVAVSSMLLTVIGAAVAMVIRG